MLGCVLRRSAQDSAGAPVVLVQTLTASESVPTGSVSPVSISTNPFATTRMVSLAGQVAVPQLAGRALGGMSLMPYRVTPEPKFANCEQADEFNGRGTLRTTPSFAVT